MQVKSEVRLHELEPYLNELKETLLQIKRLVDAEAWEGNIKGLASDLIAAIVSGYLDAHLPPYEALEAKEAKEAR